MSVSQSAAAALLRMLAKARRYAPAATLYAIVPTAWKLRIAKRLLRSATGADEWPIMADSSANQMALPALRPDPRYGKAGVNLCGYVRGEFGLAESVRLFALALAQYGYPFSLVDFELPAPGRAEDHTLDAWLVERGEHPLSVYFVNPDQMQSTREHFKLQARDGRYIIGYWYWELEKFPTQWRGALDLVDEVWVASDFVRRSVAAITDKPVLRMPVPIDLSTTEPDRARFGLPADRFVFLFTFDYHSYPQRKNPEALIAAFQAAFPPGREDVCLFIKTIHADRVPDAHLDLTNAARADPRILVRDGHLSREEMYGLIASADVYVSLHRSEGFGLGMIEAMYLGKPVIATAYSGNLDFMSESEACLVDYRRADVPAGAYPHWQDQQWAEPDIDQAARHMRRLADDPVAARTLGAAAAVRIRRQYARAACASAAVDRLQAIAAGWNPAARSAPGP